VASIVELAQEEKLRYHSLTHSLTHPAYLMPWVPIKACTSEWYGK